MTSAQVQRLFCTSPQVLAALAGDTHHNKIRYADCGPGKPGYAQIQTTSAMDWPQQSRLVEVVVNAKGQLALVTTMIDQAAPPQIDPSTSSATTLQLASISRALAYELADGSTAGTGTRTDRNVLIPLHRKAS